MSIVDGCVFVVCSGANVRFGRWADWMDETAPRASRGGWFPRSSRIDRYTRDGPRGARRHV
jgi:hypothetical protein